MKRKIAHTYQDPTTRKMTAADKRRYYYLCESLSSEAKDGEELFDCLYRIKSERDAAFFKIARLAIQPKN